MLEAHVSTLKAKQQAISKGEAFSFPGINMSVKINAHEHLIPDPALLRLTVDLIPLTTVEVGCASFFKTCIAA